MAINNNNAIAVNNILASNDTTITINNQKIVVIQDGVQTTVKVFKANGKEMTQTSETQFVDGQEVEKVYVTSPFTPQPLNKRKRYLESHYPTVFFGSSQLPSSMGGNQEMHSRDSKSWEWGITLTSFCFRLTNQLAFTSSLTPLLKKSMAPEAYPMTIGVIQTLGYFLSLFFKPIAAYKSAYRLFYERRVTFLRRKSDEKIKILFEQAAQAFSPRSLSNYSCRIGVSLMECRSPLSCCLFCFCLRMIRSLLSHRHLLSRHSIPLA